MRFRMFESEIWTAIEAMGKGESGLRGSAGETDESDENQLLFMLSGAYSQDFIRITHATYESCPNVDDPP